MEKLNSNGQLTMENVKLNMFLIINSQFLIKKW
jgi:hypothetical protein